MIDIAGGAVAAERTARRCPRRCPRRRRCAECTNRRARSCRRARCLSRQLLSGLRCALPPLARPTTLPAHAHTAENAVRTLPRYVSTLGDSAARNCAQVAAEREAAFSAKRAETLGQDERLREAARTGETAIISSWPAGDAAINKPGQGGWAALHFGAREGRVEVLRTLLAKGADIRLRTSKGEQPLHCAAANGHLHAVQLLLRTTGCDVNAPGPYKATALHVASTPAVARALLDAGADRTIKYRSRTPEVHHREKGNSGVANAIQSWLPGSAGPGTGSPALNPAEIVADDFEEEEEQEQQQQKEKQEVRLPLRCRAFAMETRAEAVWCAV